MSPDQDDDTLSSYGDGNDGNFFDRAKDVYDHAFDPKNHDHNILTDGEGRASKKPLNGAGADDSTKAQGLRERNVGTTNAKPGGGAASSIASKTTPAGIATKAGANFVNKVSGRSGKQSSDGMTLRGVLNKAIPVLLIVGVMGGFIGVSTASQMGLPIAIAENVLRNFDSMSVENQMVGKSYLQKKLNPKTRSIAGHGEAKEYLKKHGKVYAFFHGGDSGENYFKLSDYQKNKLKNKGIELVDIDPSDPSAGQYMKYSETDSSGNVKKTVNVVADESQVGKVPGSITYEFAMSGDGNSSFSSAYYEGAKTFRSAVGDWFKKGTIDLLQKLGIQRNRFDEYKRTGDEDVDSKAAIDIVSESQGDTDDGLNGRTQDTEPNLGDSSGDDQPSELNPDAPTKDGDSSGLNLKTGDGADGNAKAVESHVKSKMDAVSKKANGAADLTCFISEIVGNVNTLVSAYELLVTIRLASTILEGIQKTQVADSSESPVQSLMNAFTDRSSTQTIEVADLGSTKKGSMSGLSSDSDGENASIATKEYSSKKSAMESVAMAALFGGTVVGIASSPSFSSMNITDFMRSIMKRVGSSMGTLKTCAYKEMAEAAIGFASDVKKIAQCFFPPVVGCLKSLADQAVEWVKDAAFEAAKAVAKAIIVSALTPFIANLFTKTVATAFFGENLGTQFVTGAHAYNEKIHHSQGGSYLDKEQYTTYLNLQDEYERSETVYASNNKSPFDMTSPYTFAGKLYSKAISFNSAVANPTGNSGILSAILNTTNSSLRTIIPGASAAGNGITAEEAWNYTKENCPDQASVGIIAEPMSAICVAKVGTLAHTTKADPGEVLYNISQYDDNFEDSGDSESDIPEIKSGSEYAKYLEACAMNDVQPGVPNYELKDKYEGSATGTTIGDTVVGTIPLVGNALSFFSSGRVIQYAPYINGEACNPNYDEGAFSLVIPTSEKRKDYNSFQSMVRVSVAEGSTENNIVQNYIDKYYEEHPLDTSFEGILAHYSGLRKETVIATIEQLQTFQFLAQYQPAEYGPIQSEEIEENFNIASTNEQKISDYYTIRNNYLDIKQRKQNYTV